VSYQSNWLSSSILIANCCLVLSEVSCSSIQPLSCVAEYWMKFIDSVCSTIILQGFVIIGLGLVSYARCYDSCIQTCHIIWQPVLLIFRMNTFVHFLQHSVHLICSFRITSINSEATFWNLVILAVFYWIEWFLNFGSVGMSASNSILNIPEVLNEQTIWRHKPILINWILIRLKKLPNRDGMHAKTLA